MRILLPLTALLVLSCTPALAIPKASVAWTKSGAGARDSKIRAYRYLKDRVETSIEVASTMGEFSSFVVLDRSDTWAARDRVVRELRELGYVVEVSYGAITITWGKRP